MWNLSHTAAWLGLVLMTVSMTATAAEVPKMERDGQIYSLRLSAGYPFHQVMEVLKINLFDQGWIVRDVNDADIAMRKYGKLINNKVIQVTKPEYLKQAIEQDPLNALALSQGVVVYVDLSGVAPESYRTEPGDIVIAFVDPAHGAQCAGLDKLPMAKSIASELQAAVNETAAFFVGPDAVVKKAGGSAGQTGTR